MPPQVAKSRSRVSEIGKGRIPIASGGKPGKVPTPQTGQNSRAQSDTRLMNYQHAPYVRLTTCIDRLADEARQSPADRLGHVRR